MQTMYFCVITAVELHNFLAYWQSLPLVQEWTWRWKHRQRRLNNALFLYCCKVISEPAKLKWISVV